MVTQQITAEVSVRTGDYFEQPYITRDLPYTDVFIMFGRAQTGSIDQRNLVLTPQQLGDLLHLASQMAGDPSRRLALIDADKVPSSPA